MGKKLTIEEYKKAKKLLDKGLKVEAVADLIGRGDSTVRQIKRAKNWDDYNKQFVVSRKQKRDAQKREKGLDVVIIEFTPKTRVLKNILFALALIALCGFVTIALISLWRRYGA